MFTNTKNSFSLYFSFFLNAVKDGTERQQYRAAPGRFTVGTQQGYFVVQPQCKPKFGICFYLIKISKRL